MILLSWVRFIHWYDIGDIMTGAACGAGNANLPAHLISPLVFIEVYVVLSFVSPYFMLKSCLLDFEFWLFLLFDCLVSIFFTSLFTDWTWYCVYGYRYILWEGYIYDVTDPCRTHDTEDGTYYLHAEEMSYSLCQIFHDRRSHNGNKFCFVLFFN